MFNWPISKEKAKRAEAVERPKRTKKRQSVIKQRTQYFRQEAKQEAAKPLSKKVQKSSVQGF
jgi:hypothetical protein